MKSKTQQIRSMSHYVTISSNNNLKYFPDNKAYNFRTTFQAPLVLKGNWMVALVDAFIVEPSSKVRYSLCLYSDVSDGYTLHGENSSLLRVIHSRKSGNWVNTYDKPQYLPVKKSEIRELEICIKDRKGNLATVLKSSVMLTLHFKSYPFLS